MSAAAPLVAPAPAPLIDALPTDLLVEVFAHFPAHPLRYAISPVCRRWRVAAALAMRTAVVVKPTPERLALLSRFTRLTSLTFFFLTLPPLLRHLEFSHDAPLAPPYPVLTSLHVYRDRCLWPGLLDAVASSLRSLRVSFGCATDLERLAQRRLPALTELRLDVWNAEQHDVITPALRLLTEHASQLHSLHLDLSQLKESDMPLFTGLRFPALRSLAAPASSLLLRHHTQLTALTLLHGIPVDFAKLEREGAAPALRALVSLEMEPDSLEEADEEYLHTHSKAPIFRHADCRNVLPATLPLLASVSLRSEAHPWSVLPHLTATTYLGSLLLTDQPPPPALSLPRLRTVFMLHSRESVASADECTRLVIHTLTPLVQAAPALQLVSIPLLRLGPAELPLLQLLERAGVREVNIRWPYCDKAVADSVARQFCWLRVVVSRI